MSYLPFERGQARADLQFVTPLPPATTGIAQYSRDLLAAVDGAWIVDVFPEGGYEDPGWSTIRLRGKHRRRTLDPQLPTILNVGNSGFHEFAYALARRKGAIVVLHDVVLHFGRLGEFIKRGRSSEYKREMHIRYGEEGARFAAQLLGGRRPESFVEYPLCEEFVERSAATVVHSAYARDLVQHWVPGANIWQVPMGVPLPVLVDRFEAREALGIPSDSFVVASITHVNPFKRIPIVLEAMRHVVRDIPRALLIIAGTVAPGMDLEGHISRLGLQHHVHLTGYVTDDHARLLARAADVAVNLRYPSAGETSASLLRLLGSGLPVIVSDDIAASEYDACGIIRAPIDVGEIESIASTLLRLATNPEERAVLGGAAREFVENEHSMVAAVEGYRAVLAGVAGRTLPDVHDMVLDEPAPNVSVAAAELPGLETITSLDATVADALIALRLDTQDDTIRSVARVMTELRLDVPHTGGHRMDEDLPIRKELLEILACPACHGELRVHGKSLICLACGRQFAIEDGIPILIVADEQ
jgi:glycosyltransferase involved in cell wall biosynthesis/uncharacterized protein YbaR (Trm112 family)